MLRRFLFLSLLSSLPLTANAAATPTESCAHELLVVENFLNTVSYDCDTISEQRETLEQIANANEPEAACAEGTGKEKRRARKLTIERRRVLALLRRYENACDQ